MKTLGSSILGLQVVVLLLAIPVTLSVADRGPVAAWSFAALALLALVAAILFRRAPRAALTLGWLVQLLSIASGVLVPAMYFVGVLFAVVWWTAVHFGAKVDALEAARAAGNG